MYCLAMHPEVLKRLRDEILSVVGPERRPTYDDLREMKYLRAVINGDYNFFRIMGLQDSDSVLFTRYRGLEALSPSVSQTFDGENECINTLYSSVRLIRGRRSMPLPYPIKRLVQSLGMFQPVQGMHFAPCPYTSSSQ